MCAHTHMHTSSLVHAHTRVHVPHTCTHMLMHVHMCSLYLHTQMFGKSKEMHKEMKSMIALDRKVSNN